MPSPSHIFPTLTGPSGPKVPPPIPLSQVTQLKNPPLTPRMNIKYNRTEISAALKMSAVRLIQFNSISSLWNRTKADVLNKYCLII